LWAAGVAVAVAHTGFDAADGGTGDALVAALGLEGCGGFGPVVPAGQVQVVTFLPAESVELVATAMSAAGAGVIGNYSGCSFRAEGTGVFTADEGSTPVVGSSGPNKRPEIRLEMIAPRTRLDEVIAALSATHPYEQPAYNVGDVRSNVGLIGRIGEPSAPFSGSERPVRKVAVVPGSGGSFLKAAIATGSDVFVTGDIGHHSVREALDRGLAVIDPGHAPTERPGMTWLLEVVTEVGNAHGAVTVDFVGLDPTPWR
jgi:putative NIF3 family GTP cyclohydrolase 1 type 2